MRPGQTEFSDFAIAILTHGNGHRDGIIAGSNSSKTHDVTGIVGAKGPLCLEKIFTREQIM
jgi:hypothetical protein